jgi:TRAP-type C4-dicarboxylate transport system substrate-binding protein
MKFHRRHGWLGVTTVAVVLAVSSCGGDGDDTGSEDGAAATQDGAAATSECEDVTLRLSHQWPEPAGEEGDFRSVLAQRFADQVAEETNGQVTVQVFPGNSLVASSTEQYDAMMQDAVELSVFPLDYASGRVPEFSVTLMPALVRTHAEAQAWQTAPIGDRIREIVDEAGIRVLTWVWNAGGIGVKGDPVTAPSDVRSGMTMRAAGSYVERMLESAGAGISSMPSNEIYTGLQTGVLDAAVTSTGSFASFKLQEQISSYTSPTENTFWFMFEPLIISNESFDGLCAEQQDAVVSVGESLQEFAYTASEEDDVRVEKLFADAGVEVVTMDDAAMEQWRELAEEQWAAFADGVPTGQELLDLALDVSGE